LLLLFLLILYSAGYTYELMTMNTAPLLDDSQHLFFEAALAAIPDHVYVFDKQHRFVYVNQATQNLFGDTIVPGKTMLELNFPEAIANMLNGYIDHIFSTGEKVQDEIFYDRPVGGRIWFEFFWSPLRSAEGDVEFIIGISRDITERKKVDDALKESEDRFRTYVAASSDLVYRMSPDWKEMYVLNSNALLENTERPSNEWMKHYIPQDEYEHVTNAIDEAIGKKGLFDIEHRVIQANGQIGWVHSRALPVLNHDGNIIEWRGAAKDITQRKAAEYQLLYYNVRLAQDVLDRTAELQASRDLLETVFDATFHAFSVLKSIRDGQNRIIDFEWIYANKKIINRTQNGELVGKRFLSVYPGVERTPWFGRYIHVVESGEILDVEERYELNGLRYHVVAQKMGDGIIITSDDTTDRKLAEEKLRELESRQQQEIIRSTLIALEEERQRIAESLHNGLGQLLYGIKISLANLSQNVAFPFFEESKAYTNRLLIDAIAESRRISHELTPAILEEFGLQTAIEDICEQLGDEIHFTCKVEGNPRQLEKYLEIAVYRMVQELMTNVVKHAQAKKATTEVIIGSGEVVIKVTDNGRGMSASKTQRPGIGLASMRSKVKLLNGRMDIHSNTSGTSVEVVIPISKNDA
jgi:two-component system, NarL family, sensor kinase